MATRRIRVQAGVVTSSLAAVALLVGPGSTWGVDVPVVGDSSGVTTQVTGTTESVVTQVEQTVQTTTTTVEQTVQQVEAVAPAPAPAPEPVTTQVQSPVQTVASAPAETVERATTQVRTRAGRTAAPTTRAGRATSGGNRVDVARGAGDSARESARKTADRASGQVRAARDTLSASRRSRAAARDDELLAPQCAQLALPVSLPGLDLAAILSVLCAAGDDLLPAGTDGGATTRTADPLASLAKVLGVVVAGAGSPDARAALLERLARGLTDRQMLKHAGADAPSVRGAATTVAGAPGGRAALPALGTVAHTDAVAVQDGVLAASAAERRERATASQAGPGTTALATVLLIDLILLAGIVMWRAARRWVVPRFA